MKHYVVCIILICTLSTGCSSVKSLLGSRQTRPADVETAARPTDLADSGQRSTENHSAGNAGKNNAIHAEPKTEPGIEEKWEPTALPRTAMHFGEAESTHVRASNIANNPFPASGELTVIPETLRPEFYYPYPGKLISPYGRRGRSMHTGIDIKAVPNDTIRAAMPGVVRMAKLYGGYGNVVVIRHYNGLETLYGHLSKNLVRVNDAIEAGEAVGLAGRTGRATTEHLHFEVRVGGEPINPALLVDPDRQALRPDTLYLYYRNGNLLAGNHARSPEEQQAEIAKSSVTPSAASVAGTATAARGQATPASTNSQATQYHKVQQGDTLSAIARKYHTTVPKLCQLNSIESSATLRINQRVRVM